MIDFSLQHILRNSPWHATPNRFTICTANARVEDEMVYIAIIVDNSNPNLQAITADFKETADALTNKPE